MMQHIIQKIPVVSPFYHQFAKDAAHLENGSLHGPCTNVITFYDHWESIVRRNPVTRIKLAVSIRTHSLPADVSFFTVPGQGINP